MDVLGGLEEAGVQSREAQAGTTSISRVDAPASSSPQGSPVAALTLGSPLLPRDAANTNTTGPAPKPPKRQGPAQTGDTLMDKGDKFTQDGWVTKDDRPASIRVIVNPEFVFDRDALAMHPANLPSQVRGPGWRDGLYSSAWLNGDAA